MTTHILTRTIDGIRYRYFGGWNDERFHGMPYIKEYGHVPPGWQTVHLSAEEMKDRSGERFRLMRDLPILAENTAISHIAASAEKDLQRALRDRKAVERQSQRVWDEVIVNNPNMR